VSASARGPAGPQESALDGSAEAGEVAAPAATEAAPDVPASELMVGGLVVALCGAALLPLIAAVLARAVGGARIPGAVFFARWGFRHVLAATAVGFAASILMGMAVQALGLGFVGLLFASQLLLGVVAAVALAQARRLHPDGLSALGLRLAGAPNAALGGLIAYALYFPVLYGGSLAWPGLARLVGIEVQPQAVAEGMLALEGVALLFGVVAAVGVAPVLEEVVFRGYLQPLLVQNLHAPAGIAATSLVFAALHSEAFLPIFVLSVLLGWVHWRTHSTLACIAVHGLHNGLMMALMLIQKASQII